MVFKDFPTDHCHFSASAMSDKAQSKVKPHPFHRGQLHNPDYERKPRCMMTILLVECAKLLVKDSPASAGIAEPRGGMSLRGQKGNLNQVSGSYYTSPKLWPRLCSYVRLSMQGHAEGPPGPQPHSERVLIQRTMRCQHTRGLHMSTYDDCW